GGGLARGARAHLRPLRASLVRPALSGPGARPLDHEADRGCLRRHHRRREPTRKGLDVHRRAPACPMSLRPRILLVDDDPELRQSLVDLLEDEGYRPHTAASGRQALAALRDPDLPDLILLDLMMPDLNGWQFCDMQRKDPRLAAI